MDCNWSLSSQKVFHAMHSTQKETNWQYEEATYIGSKRRSIILATGSPSGNRFLIRFGLHSTRWLRYQTHLPSCLFVILYHYYFFVCALLSLFCDKVDIARAPVTLPGQCHLYIYPDHVRDSTIRFVHHSFLLLY